MSETVNQKCKEELEKLEEDPEYSAALKTFKQVNGQIKEGDKILRDCPCLMDDSAKKCVCDLQKKKVWKGVAEIEKACTRVGGKFCFTNEYIKDADVDISLIHLTPQCVPLKHCRDRDIALIGEAIFQNRGTIELSCPFVQMGQDGKVLGSGPPPQGGVFQAVLTYGAIFAGLAVCIFQCFQFFQRYKKERDRMWTFEPNSDDYNSSMDENDFGRLRRRKLEVEMSQRSTEQSSIEVDLDQLNQSSRPDRSGSSSLKCV